MSWAKRNLYFLISCIVAVALLGAAGWYAYSSWQSNNAAWEQLSQAYAQLSQIASKPIGAGNAKVDNITTAREQTKEARDRVAEMEKFFAPLRPIPNTNVFNDRLLAFAVRQTVSDLRSAAASHNVVVPPEFDFSFSLQEGKAIYDPTSWDHLAKQLGEVRGLCDVLFASRIIQLDSIQRERTADDNAATTAGATQPDYLDSTSLTNGNTVITPYQLSFQCFTPELGFVLSSFANQPHTFVVKTLDVQPQELVPGGYGGGYPMAGGYPGGGYPGGGYPNNPYAGGEPGNAAQPGMFPMVIPGRPLPTVIDEKKLKVIMLVDIVKILPAQGR